jgi:hypothetical protein
MLWKRLDAVLERLDHVRGAAVVADPGQQHIAGLARDWTYSDW